MGWDICEANREATPLEYFNRHVAPRLTRRIIAAAQVNSTVYAVDEDGFGLVCRTKDCCGHKLIGEDCGPSSDRCPMGLLQMLKWPAPNQWAKSWRLRCAARFRTPVRWQAPGPEVDDADNNS